MAKLAEMLSLRKQRLSLQRQVDVLEQKEKGILGEIIADLQSKKKKPGYVLKDGEDEAVLEMSTEPVAMDWPSILDFIIENDAVDLLQKRLTPSAVKARWDDKITIPGISAVDKYTLKLNS